jgi:HSP20 family protein
MRSLIPYFKKHQVMPTSSNLFNDFRQELDSIFDRALLKLPFSTSVFEGDQICVDIDETEKEVIIKADCPGFEQKDISVNLDNNYLIIEGEKTEEEEKNIKNRIVKERRYGQFSRSIYIPFSVESDKVDASLKNGVLHIKIPKSKEALQNVKRIAVKKET